MIQDRQKESGTWHELRSVFPLIAAALIVSGLILPFWSVTMHAPQYPDKALVIRIYDDRMDGDVYEYNTLNKYVGVSFPEHMPEFKIFPYLLSGFAVLSFVLAFVPNGLRAKGLAGLLLLMLLFMLGGAADLQYRLYDTGTNLDTDAPVKGVEPFIPPILGPNQVGNFSTFSLFRSGSVTLGLGFLFLLIAFLNRYNPITCRQWLQKWQQRLRVRKK